MTCSGMTSVRSRRSAARSATRSDCASVIRRVATRPSSAARASCSRRPASLRASGSSEPNERWAPDRAERFPNRSVSTCARASVDAAAAIGGLAFLDDQFDLLSH